MAWTPDKNEALKVLIRQTIDAAGPIDAASLPHRIKERLQAQIDSDVDLDALIGEVMKEKR